MNSMHQQWERALKGTADEQVLAQMTHDEIEGAFSGSIVFGTGGLRGIMGIGTNRLNRYTVQRMIQGLAKIILTSDAPKSVGVSFDTRYNSSEFAKYTCEVLVAYGIETFIFDKAMPTPTLSHAIRLMNLGWGVVITASHNPQQYNGIKVYDRHGVQVTDGVANEITKSIGTVEFFECLPTGMTATVKVFDDKVNEAYINQIVSFASSSDKSNPYPLTSSPYKLVYSALHGAGANALPTALEKLGFSPVCIQMEPDGSFGGLKTPNPEEPVVYEVALEEAKKIDAKLLLATDPDCDRVGVMIKTQDGFKLLSGNQIGALLIDYLAVTRGVMPGDTVISTIVSGMLGELVSKEHGLEFVRLLTGFKYIGEYIENMSEGKQFFFGYEESCGYLAGDGARDKDATIASALIVKMAEYYDAKGMTLFDRLQEISEKYGYCLESLTSVDISQNDQKEVMSKLREKIRLSSGEKNAEDYLTGLNGLPKSNVVKLYINNSNDNENESKTCGKSWAAVRPSGTEPKLKLYVGVHEKTLEEAKNSIKMLSNRLINELGVN
ncbi:MAG: phospho-sugar mutase [Oscillospiraceae bacterium]|nr:phospho-sugar mutase [Oscillospiraceae bacterium]